jgi:hypothetical protein
MNTLHFIVCLSMLTILSCRNKEANKSPIVNDTTAIINASVKYGTSDEYMPSASSLKRIYKFRDSILLTSTSLSLGLLPEEIEHIKFKVLTKEQICSIINSDNLFLDLPNYLNLKKLEKTDSGYYVQLENVSCLQFGGGGSLWLYFKKKNDSWIIVDQFSSSIN